MLITHTCVNVIIVKWKLMEDLWWEFWERESESMLLTVLFLMAYPQSLTLVTGDQAVTGWPGSDVWQPVGGGDLITTDYSIIYSNRFQAGDHWPLTHGRHRHLWSWPGSWSDIRVMVSPCDQASTHSLSHYIVPESHWPHALTPVREIDVNLELRHFKFWVNWVPSPITRISFPRV